MSLIAPSALARRQPITSPGAVACVGGLADRAGYAIVIRRWIWLRDDGRLGGAEQILHISDHIRRRFA